MHDHGTNHERCCGSVSRKIEHVSTLYLKKLCGESWNMNHCVANRRVTKTTTERDSVIFFFCSRGMLFGMCLDLVFGPIWDFLCVVCGARLVCCNRRWLHTRWCFSLVPDPIIYVVLRELLKGNGGKRKTLCVFSQNEAHDNSGMSRISGK